MATPNTSLTTTPASKGGLILNPTTATPNASLEADWQAGWDANAGKTVAGPNGSTIKFGTDNTATYTDANGQARTVNRSDPLSQVAQQNPDIGTAWNNAYGFKPTQYGTQPWEVTPEQTVSGQFNQLTAEGNPLMQQAETQAKQQAQGRGLLNSSLAVTGGQLAAYNAALPIAQSDAATYAKSAETNAAALNTANLTQAETANKLASAEKIAGLSKEAQITIAGMGEQTQKDLALAQLSYNSLKDVSSGALTANTTLQSTLNTIAASDQTPEAKAAAVTFAINNYKAVLGTIASVQGVDISPFIAQWTT